MKRKLSKTITSLLLVICLLTGIVPVASFADSELSKGYTLEDIIAGNASVDDVFGTIDASTVPEIIGYENAVSKNHIQRLYSEEGNDLNKLVFLNADGSKTEYIYDFPVKYLDDSNTVKDITLDITPSQVSGQFETANNSTVTTFSHNIVDGIQVKGNNETISLVPHLPKTSAESKMSTTTKVANISTVKKIDNKTVSYYYNDKTSIEYSLTYTGFKEDIVVNEYTGQTEYEFTLYTNGLKLVENNNSFYLVDNTDTVKAVLGDIIIFTADEKNNTMGDMVSKTVVENQEYLLTILVDPDFLSNDDTIYPIRIDPTVEICYDNNGDGAISDVTLNSNTDSSATSGSLSVGLRETYGISRILMKFPGLNLSSLGNDITITNATVEIRDLMCEGTELDVSCYVFSGNVWDESTVCWANVNPNSISTFLSSNVISYANGKQQAIWHRYAFDITKAVEGWRTGNYNPNKGIIFKGPSSVENGTTYNCKTIASYNRSSNKPSLSVTYSTTSNFISNDTYYLNNRHCGDYLQYASSAATASSGLISSLGNSIRWEIISVDGGYIIRSKSDPSKYLAVPSNISSTSVSIVTVNDSTISQKCIWSITMASGGGCLVKNTYNSKYLYSFGNSVCTVSGTGAVGTSLYDSQVWRIAATDYYGNTSSHFKRELMSGFTITCGNADVGETINLTVIKNPDNALWTSIDDFTYTTSDTSRVSINNNTLTALSSGAASITATHKVTGLTKTFYVTIFSGTFDVYIFASGISLDNIMSGSMAGHGWIEIISNSAHEYTIGHYELAAGESVTIGRWGSQINQATDGNFVGLWYNREVYEFNINDKYISSTYSYVTVNKNTIDQISSLILSSYSGYHLTSNNCVKFAINAWNLCVNSNDRISTTIITPNGLINAIETLQYHYSGNSHSIPATIVCGFYNGSTYIEHICD